MAEPRPPRPEIAAIALPGCVFLALVVLMELAKRGGWLPITVPGPSEIAAAVPRSWSDLLYHAGPTILASTTGYLIAASLAMLLGALAVASNHTERTVFRLGLVVDSVPLIALTPILMVWIGTGMTARITISTIAACFPLLVGAIQGLKATDRNRLELFHVLAASPWQRLTLLQWPTALPYLFAALRIAAPLAVLGALIAEWVNAERGLGIMMVYALFSFDVPLVWLTIVSVCGLAMLAYGLVALVERLVLSGWPEARQAGLG